MAQQGASMENKSTKQRPKPIELQNSTSHRHCSSSAAEPADNRPHLSPAELYINQKSQMIFDLNDPPLQTGSVASSTTSNNHAEIMREWHEKQRDEIYRNEPHRYRYDTPPSSCNSLSSKNLQRKK